MLSLGFRCRYVAFQILVNIMDQKLNHLEKLIWEED